MTPGTSNAPFEVIVLGSGHYVTGFTSRGPSLVTDKDWGVILPSLFYLRSIGEVDKITLVGQSTEKLAAVARRFGEVPLFPFVDKTFCAVAGSSGLVAISDALDAANSSTVVIIALPDHLHKMAMLECISRSLPFLVVKPAVTRLEDFYEVANRLPNDLVAMVDYHKVYDQANLVIRDALSRGTIGDVQFVSSVMSQRKSMLEVYSRWLNSEPGPNVNHYLGSHYIHLTSKLVGALPVQVRATQQFGQAAQTFNRPIADRIQTHVLWRRDDGVEASSFHVSGWTDSTMSPSMTRQEIEIFGSSGSIRSDQANRGIVVSSDGEPPQSPNPYFFGLQNSSAGNWDPAGLYGYQSVAKFFDALREGNESPERDWVPHFRDSEIVTAVLEASDWSLQRGSTAILIERDSMTNEFRFSNL